MAKSPLNRKPGNGADDDGSVPELEAVKPSRTAADVLRDLELEPDPEEPFIPPPPEASAKPAPSAPAPVELVTPPAPVNENLARCLLAEGPITREFLRQQIAVSGKSDTYVGKLLAATKAPAEHDLLRVVAAGYRIPEIDLRKCKLQAGVALSLPREVALKYHVVALEQIGDLLCVAFDGQPNPKAFEAVRRATGMKLRAFRAPKPLVVALLRRLYSMTPPQPKPPDDDS